MTTPPLASLLIGSSNVAAMMDWYRQGFGAVENDMGAFEFGAVGVFIEEHSDVAGPATQPARIILNLNVDDCRAVEAQLVAAGTTWVRPVEQAQFGLIGTAADPDGNYVQIIQWGATPEDHRA